MVEDGGVLVEGHDNELLAYLQWTVDANTVPFLYDRPEHRIIVACLGLRLSEMSADIAATRVLDFDADAFPVEHDAASMPLNRLMYLILSASSVAILIASAPYTDYS